MPGPIGIDLGTTNSVIAHIREGGVPEIVPNSEGSAITPSVICFRDGETIIGSEARELQAAGEPDAVASFKRQWRFRKRDIASFKRQMGDPEFVFHVDGTDYTATDLSGLLLGKLKRDAEAYLGHSVTDAVITVPAYFRDPERLAVREAGSQAGKRRTEGVLRRKGRKS